MTKNKVTIVKTAIATSLGDTLEDNWRRLIQGESAIDTIGHFNTDRLPYHLAACVPNLRKTDTANHTRPLMQRVLDQLTPIPSDTYIIWTGIKSNAEYIEAKDNRSGPHLPAHYRHWAADYLGIANRGMEVNAACAASTVGLALGAQQIALGKRKHVLVCGADLVTRFGHTGFSALKALTKTGNRPFDRERDGMCLGDGAYAILLSNDDIARKQLPAARVHLAGWGISNDAVHITGPARDGRGLTAAIHTALQTASVKPDLVEAFCAHGTGTVYNDAMELTAVSTVFGPRRFPIFSIKGAIGHTLGAAGGIETALCGHAMEHQWVPPTIGLENPEKGAVGRISSAGQSFGGNNILTTNSGFGGVNAALLLKAAIVGSDRGGLLK